mmetsp:Transcript_3110/g.8586  ORF Transcript_3110/g.8586 Transcript_3110/m.8586 type:complete len:210 (+) Transcript_3110:863-1492(+)
MTICPARWVFSAKGLVRMTRILRTVTTSGVSYLHETTSGRSFCSTIFHWPSSSEMGRYKSSSRRRARWRSCSQLRQSVTGISEGWSLLSWESVLELDADADAVEVVVPITPHTSSSSSTISLSTDMRRSREVRRVLVERLRRNAALCLGLGLGCCLRLDWGVTAMALMLLLRVCGPRSSGGRFLFLFLFLFLAAAAVAVAADDILWLVV